MCCNHICKCYCGGSKDNEKKSDLFAIMHQSLKFKRVFKEMLMKEAIIAMFFYNIRNVLRVHAVSSKRARPLW